MSSVPSVEPLSATMISTETSLWLRREHSVQVSVPALFNVGTTTPICCLVIGGNDLPHSLEFKLVRTNSAVSPTARLTPTRKARVSGRFVTADPPPLCASLQPEVLH